MKRPLLLAAAVLAFGIYAVSFFEAGSRLLFGAVPPLRASMEETGEEFISGELIGTVTAVRFREERFLLTVKSALHGKVQVYLRGTAEEIRALIGSEASFQGSFFLYETETNFGGFSVRDYFDRQGVYLAFTAECGTVLNPGRRYLQKALFTLRSRLNETLRLYSKPEDYGFFLNVLFADRTAMPEEERHLYERQALQNALSSSGMLLGAIALGIFEFIRRRTLKKWIPAFSAGLFLLLYVGIAGLTPAFLRAAVLTVLRAGAHFVKRKFDLLNASALSWIVLLLVQPGFLWTSTFLFHLAVFFAFGVLEPLVSDLLFFRNRRWSGILRVLSAQIALLPVQLYTSYRFSIFAPVSLFLFFTSKTACFGLLSVGTVTGSILPFKAGFPAFFFHIAHVLHTYQSTLVEWIDGLPFSVLRNGRPETVSLIVYAGIAALSMIALRVLFLLRKKKPETKEHRVTGRTFLLTAVLMAAFFLFGIGILRTAPLSKEELRITMADVGQGDGFLLETKGHAVLIDGGSTSKQGVGGILENTWTYFGEGRIEYAFVTHADEDHVSGILELLESGRGKIRTLVLPKIRDRTSEFRQLIERAGAAGAEVLYVSAGDRMTLDSVVFTVLSPDENALLTGNDGSLVLSVSAGGFDLLFTGDISSEVESRLPIDHPYELLKVAHHGSKYSSGRAFLKRVSPAFALISFGKRNSYGHPSEETLSRLLQASDGVKIFGTGACGAVSLTVRKGEVSVRFAVPGQSP